MLDNRNNITYDQDVSSENPSITSKSTWSPFDKSAIILTVILFIVIILLTLYLFNVISLSSFLPIKKATQPIGQTNSTGSGDSESKINLINPTFTKVFTNKSDQWSLQNVPNNKVRVSSALELNTTLLIKFDEDAPLNSNTGILFYNGLLVKDPNTRRLSIVYLLKNKQWLLQYQSGKTVKSYILLNAAPANAFGTFSLSISSDGKKVTVSIPNQTTKSIDLPASIYDITNQMTINILVGPKSNATVSSLNYNLLTD